MRKPKSTKKGSTNPRTKKTFSSKKKSFSARGVSKKGKSTATKKESAPVKKPTDEIRLNKYVANTGLCSRREADKLIEQGKIKVNGKVISELGTKVSIKDKISFNGKPLKTQNHVYFLLNKPKNYITTTKDPKERKTVMHLMANVCKERIYPVGRLDRMTTGLLLFTNDGDTAKKLTHPSSEIQKMYTVDLNKNLKVSDLDKIKEGLELEDGFATVDSIHFDGEKLNKKKLILTLHSGKNRIIRRIFEHLDYTVVKLDRIYFAGLNKKDLPRGRSRALTQMEVNMLHMIKSKKGPA
ncbi:MAG: rRNA pseudouridine synthase [Bacteroidia bacterium]|nr:rRNA pseudouridine synthase [Bacteroidia bacterium]NNC85016.1 rRNA pseudouridine synthase [Bacteroidia bacterium]